MYILGKCVCYMYASTSQESVCVYTVLHVTCVCMCTPGKCVCVCVLCMHIQQSLFQSCEHVSDCEPMCKHVFLSVNERCVGAYEQMCVSLCE